MNQHTAKMSSAFIYFILLIISAYLVIEYFFIPYSALAADEFVFARHIYEYTLHLPYHDFPPYKTTLGYYLLSLPFFFSHALLKPIFYIKDEIALINAVCLLLTSIWASKFFDKRAILLSLLAMLANQLFLIYAADLRVDMLTVWFALFATLAMLQYRFILSGVLLGLAFLISQKALWFAFALNAGMLMCWLTLPNSKYKAKAILSFNICAVLTVVAYIVIWSLLSSPSIVLYNLFYEAFIQAGIDFYSNIYLLCWQTVLQHGPLLFLLWPLTFIPLFSKNQIINERDLFILCFSSVSLLLFISYKQAFPYNFVFTIPAYFLLYANFLSYLFELKNKPALELASSNVNLFLFTTYLSSITVILFYIKVAGIYFFIPLIPLLVYTYIKTDYNNFKIICLRTVVLLFLMTGIVYPLYQSLKIYQFINGNYQQTMLTLANEIIQDEGDYISGVPYFYQKDQPIEGMKNLIGPALEYLVAPNEKLEKLLLSSLYLAPTTTDKVLQDFDNLPIKVIINNYRMVSLPENIANYIKQNYTHFYGSIYLYSPLITPNQLSFHLKFSGDYRIDGAKKLALTIDGKRIKANKVMTLKAGDHISYTNKPYRLVLIPAIKMQLDPTYQDDDATKMIKAIMM